MVSVSGYLIGSQAAGRAPLAPAAERDWYYFATERGRAGYAAHRRDFARLIWRSASPAWRFDDATFERSAAANGAPHPEPAAYAARFTGKYAHRTLTGGIGHNLPQEAPTRRRWAEGPGERAQQAGVGRVTEAAAASAERRPGREPALLVRLALARGAGRPRDRSELMTGLDYDVLIIGSGFGGSVAALRAAEKHHGNHQHRQLRVTPPDFRVDVTLYQ